MARDLFALEKGIRLYKENSDTEFLDILFGSPAPGGDAGEQDAAPIGSWYYRQNGASSTVYQKIANAGATSDWQENGSTSLQIGFRPEKIRAVTNENVTPGVRDLTTTPFTDDNGTTLDAGDFNVGEFIISNAGGVAVLLEVTAVSAPNVTFSTPSSAPALSEFDTFLTPNYLPDPDGQENQALVQINGSGNVVKVGDVDWNFATGINLSVGYTPGSGNITSSDSVEEAIQKLDGNNDAQDQALGLAQGATNFGTFTSPASLLLAAGQSAKQLFQRIGNLLSQLRGVEVTGITTATAVDAVPHATVKAVKWLVTAVEEATPNNRKAMEVYAVTNGTAVDDTLYARLRVGANFNLSVNVVINGANMELQVASSTAGVTATVRRIEVIKSVL